MHKARGLACWRRPAPEAPKQRRESGARPEASQRRSRSQLKWRLPFPLSTGLDRQRYSADEDSERIILPSGHSFAGSILGANKNNVCYDNAKRAAKLLLKAREAERGRRPAKAEQLRKQAKSLLGEKKTSLQ